MKKKKEEKCEIIVVELFQFPFSKEGVSQTQVISDVLVHCFGKSQQLFESLKIASTDFPRKPSEVVCFQSVHCKDELLQEIIFH